MFANLYDYSVENFGVTSRLDAVDSVTRREIQRSLSKRVHGVFASRKNHQSIPWRNRHEHSLFGLLEIDPAVRSFEAMPEKVTFFLSGKPFVHVPSTRVMTKTGVAILDVVQFGGRVAEAMASIYSTRGIAYRTIDARTLHLLPRRTNADWILTYRGFEPTPNGIMAVTNALSRIESLTIAKLGQTVNVAELHATICTLALDGCLSLDLSASTPLEMRAKLFAGAHR